MSQTAEAVLVGDPAGAESEIIIAPAAGAGGQVIQLADGRPGVVAGANAASDAYAAGDPVTVYTSGRFSLLKTASINLLAGGKAFWDRSANKANFKAASGDFFAGRVVEDSLAAATEVVVDLNVEPRYQIELHKGQWTNAAALGLGVTKVAEGSEVLMLSFDAVAEVAMAALYPVDTIPVADLGIVEFDVAIYDIGNHAALDITIALSNGTHATDYDSVTEAVIFHLDGTSLTITAESRDGTTTVANVTTTVDAVDDTFTKFWIDCRNIDDIQLYLDAINVLPASVFKLDAATGPMRPEVHIEKTSDDTLADVRVASITARSTDIAV